jgi:hypothetical protein
MVEYEHMFGTSQETIDWTFEREREAAEREVLSIREQRARLDQRLTQISRRAEERGYWKAAGCTSVAQWLAQITSSDYSAARRITATGEALRDLPALDNALSSGALTLDQVAAAAPIATPESDAEIARLAVGKAPRQVARAARMLVPPRIADDNQLYQRRALSMTWSGDGRELKFSGSLPLEQGTAFEQAIWNLAKPLRAADKKTGSPVLEWSQYCADALAALATQPGGEDDGVRRSPTTVIVHLSDDGTPPLLEGAGPISVETAERLCCDARKIAIKLCGSDLVHSRTTRCASYPQLRALYKRAGGHCQYPGCTAIRELEAHHILAYECGGKTELDNLILLCGRHHKLLHDHHIHTSGNGDQPVFTDQNGRAITTNQPHAPPR